MTMMNRKTATQLLLINWSRFQYETIRLGGSTLFTGVNGSGKSTVLDAMTYLLTGNTQFNTAAKDKDRTVKAYVRGDTKSNGENRYLRKGQVISYIAMEFFSPVENENMVIGVGIESANENDTPSSSWFICRNASLSDISFGEKTTTGMSVNPLSKLFLRGSKINRKDFLGRDKAKNQILRALGMRCDATLYRKKLMKMMSFNPENDINKFIAECVLEADPIESLAQLREQKELFEKVRAMYENLMECKKALEKLEISTQNYETKQQNYRVRELMLELSRVKIEEENIAKIQKQIDKLQSELENTILKKEDADKDCEAARSRYEASVNNAGFLDFQKTIDNLTRQEKELADRIATISKQLNKLQEMELLLGKQLSFTLENNISRNILLNISGLDNTAEEKRVAFAEYISSFKDMEEDIRREKYRLENNEKEWRGQLSEVEQKIRKLDANILHIPQKINAAKRIISEELEKEGIHTEVRTFAELVEKVTDEGYRAALETFLGKKRYNLIIDGKYCGKAMEIVEREKLHFATIVVTDKLKDSDIQNDSAASLLTIPNMYARRYANYLLNGIHLCRDVAELHQYPLGGLTKTGMLAKSYAVSLLNIKDTEMCLGSNAIELQKKSAEKERDNLRAMLSDNRQKTDDVNSKLTCMGSLDTSIDNYRFDAPESLIKAKMQLSEVRQDIDGYKNNPDFAKALEEQLKAKTQKEAAEKTRDQLNMKLGGLNTDIARNQKAVEESEARKVTAAIAYEEKRAQNADIALLAEEEYAKAVAGRDSARAITDKYVASMRNDVDRAKEVMETDQLEYCRIAGADNSRRGISYIPFYRSQYSELSVVKLEEAKNKMQEQEKNLQSAFMHDFIGEISEAIRLAKDEIALINKELRQIPFGQDTYRFIIKEKSDRAIFFRICKKLADYMNMPELYMANNNDDEEMEHDIAEFMNIILDEEDETEYTDYRKYFTYDMEIIRSIGDKEITADLSAKQGSASNGEKQTPYFIILAASLMQCYPKNSCCARLAFIDEAFSALSRERIEQMVKYFEDNDFQVIYAAPPEKIASIGQYISTTVSLFPKGNYSYAIEGLYGN